MSALLLHIVPREPGASTSALAHRVFGDALAGCIVPAHLVTDAAAESKAPLDVEAIVPEVLATRFAGESCVAALARAPVPALAWCAVVTSLPVVGGGPRPDAYLRFAIGLGTPRERLAPLCAVKVLPDRIELRFGIHGAPFVAPASRDRGGPIDAAWARARESAVADLARALGRLVAREAVTLRLTGEGLDAPLLADLGAAWRAEVLEVEGRAMVVMPSLDAGRCRACRHANQGTHDLEAEGLLACAFMGARPLHQDPSCEVEWSIDGRRWLAYEAFDGGNSTWGWEGEVRVKVPGAPPRAVPRPPRR